MVVAQVFATIAISVAGIAAFRRFPKAPSEPLGEDVRAVRGFLFSSTLASSLDSARGTLGTSLVPTVAPIVQAGYFRNAQAPATGFAALSGPARLVMLTEQTRDYEAGRYAQVFGMLKRYVAATGALMLVAVPVLWIVMPFLIGAGLRPRPSARTRPTRRGSSCSSPRSSSSGAGRSRSPSRSAARGSG